MYVEYPGFLQKIKILNIYLKIYSLRIVYK